MSIKGIAGLARGGADLLDNIDSENTYHILVPHRHILVSALRVTSINFIYYLVSFNLLIALVSFPLFITAGFLYYSFIKMCRKYGYRVLTLVPLIILYNIPAALIASALRRVLLHLLA